MELNIKFIVEWVTILVVAYVIIRFISEHWNVPLLDDGSSRTIKGFLQPDRPDESA